MGRAHSKGSRKCGKLRNMKGVYEATKKLCNEKPRHIDMVKDKDGNLLTKDDEIRKRWGEHFDNVLINQHQVQ